MEQGRVEERGIALLQRQLGVVLLEVLGELGQVEGEVAGLVLVGVGQVEGRAGLDGHVAVRDRALQGQRRATAGGPGPGNGRGHGVHEAEVVVAVRGLRLTTGVDHVDLSR